MFLVSNLLLKPIFAFSALPTIPTSIVTSPGNAKVTLTWAASTGTTPITYGIYRSTALWGTYTLLQNNITSTSYIDTTVTNNKAYFYKVYSQNSSGSSPVSTQLRAIPVSPPSAPLKLVATTTSDGKVALAWEAASVVTGSITYSVERSLSSGSGYTIINPNVTSLAYKDLSVVNGTQYFYVVKAKNSGGISSSSNVSSIKVGTATTPSAPTELTATMAKEVNVELSWKASLTGGTLNYLIYRSITSGSGYTKISPNISALSYIDNTVTRGVKYYYKVLAMNGGGLSSTYSNISSILVSGAKMLFKTSFGSGVNLDPITGMLDFQAWQNLSGTDKATGYSFPVAGFQSNSTALQLIGPYSITGTKLTADNLSYYFDNKIVTNVVGPKGNYVNELFLNLKHKDEPVGKANSQVPLLIQRPWTIPDVGDVYISYWFQLPADLASKLDPTVSSGNWRVMFEWKSGGWNNTYKGDYRMKTTVLKGIDGNLYWDSGWDNNANMSTTDISSWVYTPYWSSTSDPAASNYLVPVPVGKWFKFEVFWHRSTTNGYYWAAVNGKTIASHTGNNIGVFNLPVTRIMVTNSYSGGYGPVIGHMTDLQIWNGFPCGYGISCP